MEGTKEHLEQKWIWEVVRQRHRESGGERVGEDEDNNGDGKSQSGTKPAVSGEKYFQAYTLQGATRREPSGLFPQQ